MNAETRSETAEREALPPRWSLSWLRPVTDFDVETGLRQLASMLRSGVALLDALRTVSEQAFSPRAARCWSRVAQRIFDGSGFSPALAAEPRHFGEIVVCLCEVGESSGELARAIARAADQLESRRELRAAVVNALVYPCFAVVAAIGVCVFLVDAVIPRIAQFLQSGGAELPALTRRLMAFSEWMNASGLLVAACTGLLVVAWIAGRFDSRTRELQDLLLLRLPVTGRILRLSGTALFARSMQIMTESGVTLLEALAIGARLMANRRLRRRVAQARGEILKGKSLSDGLASAREFTPMLRSMASVGEVTGSLPEAFGEAARYHDMMLAIAVKRFGMLIEPAMIVITGLIVGVVYIAFFMAIFAMAGTK